LKGKYPKTFKFTIWHPQCHCFAAPIQKTDDEMEADDERIMNGEESSTGSVNEVKDVPENFKKWLTDNNGRIERAEKRGTLPYFLKDNDRHYYVRSTQGIQGKEILKAAKERHNARTGELKTNIQQAWDLRKNVREVESKLGVVKGKEMTFEEANELRGNPLYGKGEEYSINCQSCVVANELRRRGFDVHAAPNFNIKDSPTEKLSYRTETAWIDPKTGDAPIKTSCGGTKKLDSRGRMIPGTIIELEREFVDATKEVGRYHIDFVWKGLRSGHIITVEKLKNDNLRFYDPQTGEIRHWRGDLREKISLKWGVDILKVDSLMINADIAKGVIVGTR
jgi:hypothetical protein